VPQHRTQGTNQKKAAWISHGLTYGSRSSPPSQRLTAKMNSNVEKNEQILWSSTNCIASKLVMIELVVNFVTFDYILATVI